MRSLAAKISWDNSLAIAKSGGVFPKLRPNLLNNPLVRHALSIIPKLNRTQLTLSCLIVLCLAFDLIAPRVLRDFVQLLPFFLGVVVGQMVLLSLWSVLGIEPIVARIPRAIALFIFGGYACLWSNPALNLDFLPLLFIAIFFFMIQIPLWVIRLMFRRTICKSGQNVAGPSQFGIKTMLMWMTFVAVVVALGRYFFEGDSLPLLTNASQFRTVLTYMGFFSMFVATVGFPVAWAILLDEISPGWIGVVIAVFLLVIPGLCGMFESPVGYPTMFAVGIASMTAIGLWTARCLGYRMEYQASPADIAQSAPATRNEIDQL